MTYKLFTDGGARGNPGPAGAGVVLYDPQNKKEAELREFLGDHTNNEAEYMGLILGLRLSQQHGVKDLECFLDSELVVKQLNGEYRVKQPHLKELFDEVSLLKNSFDTVSFVHVPRSENKVADALVNLALDEHEG